MSQYLLYLPVRPFVRQWLEFHFGNPVRFPVGSVENIAIRRFITTLPAGKQPRKPESGEVAVCIPDSKQKPVESYNYMNRQGAMAVVETIEDTFRRQMWNDLGDMHDSRCSLITAVRAWCQNNGISLDHEDTVKMRYQRMRTAYLPCGIDLRDHTKIRKGKNL